MPSQTGNPPNGNLLWSDLSEQQIVQRAFQESTDTLRVDIASVEPTVVIPVVQGGLSVLGSFNIPYTSISHTSPFVITSGFASQVQQLLVSDTTGQTDKILWSSTTLYTNPGCERQYNVQIPAGIPISIESAESSDPVAGNYILTALG